jgi:hypothetical protein
MLGIEFFDVSQIIPAFELHGTVAAPVTTGRSDFRTGRVRASPSLKRIYRRRHQHQAPPAPATAPAALTASGATHQRRQRRQDHHRYRAAPPGSHVERQRRQSERYCHHHYYRQAAPAAGTTSPLWQPPAAVEPRQPCGDAWVIKPQRHHQCIPAPPVAPLAGGPSANATNGSTGGGTVTAQSIAATIRRHIAVIITAAITAISPDKEPGWG